MASARLVLHGLVDLSSARPLGRAVDVGVLPSAAPARMADGHRFLRGLVDDGARADPHAVADRRGRRVRRARRAALVARVAGPRDHARVVVRARVQRQGRVADRPRVRRRTPGHARARLGYPPRPRVARSAVTSAGVASCCRSTSAGGACAGCAISSTSTMDGFGTGSTSTGASTCAKAHRYCCRSTAAAGSSATRISKAFRSCTTSPRAAGCASRSTTGSHRAPPGPTISSTANARSHGSGPTSRSMEATPTTSSSPAARPAAISRRWWASPPTIRSSSPASRTSTRRCGR